MGYPHFRVLETLRGKSLWVIKNSGRPVILKLRTIFGRKILLFYLNLDISNIKIKCLNVKSKQDFNRITTNCARLTDASIQVSFWTKNQTQSAVLLLRITANCAPADGRIDTFQFSTIIYIYNVFFFCWFFCLLLFFL